MHGDHVSPDGHAQMGLMIERQIMLRTGGQLRRLCVEVADEKIVIHACAPSYYVKQLAIQGILDVATGRNEYGLDVDIQVS